MQENAIAQPITQLFDELAAAWCAKDFAAMRRLWQPGLATPVYVAEEHEPVMTDWSQIDAYWQQTAIGLETMQSAYRVVAAIPNGPGQWLVSFKVKWSATMPDRQQPLGGTTRGVALVALAGEEARLVAYIEAQMAPTVYTRKLMELVPLSDRWL